MANAAFRHRSVTTKSSAGRRLGTIPCRVMSLLPPRDIPLAAATMCHSFFITNDEMKEWKVPLVVLGAEIDIVTFPAKVMEYGEILHNNAHIAGPESYVKIFKAADHS